MDPVDLTPATWDPQARTAAAGYLRALAAGLPLARRTRAAVLAEVADGLACAVEAHVAAGAQPAAAARLAIAEFGDPRELAAQLAAEIAGSHARRVGVGLVATGPLVGLSWVAAFAAADGTSWWAQVGVLMPAVQVYPLVLAVSVPAALVAATGGARLAGRFRVGPRVAAGAAALAAAGCIAGDVALLGGLAGIRSGPGWTAALACAAVASLFRLSVAAVAGRRCLLLRAASR